MKSLGTIVGQHLARRSAGYALGVVGVVETAMAVADFSLSDLLPKGAGWEARLLCFIVAFACLWVATGALTYLRSRRGVVLTINAMRVTVSTGDLFTRDGLRVIPFDERFDIKVDDEVVSKSSLNGVFVQQFADGPSLGRALARREETTLPGPTESENGLIYPLGTVKRYDDHYALLAFTHVDRLGEARLTRAEFETCLMNMWRELSRIYAGRHVVLPLLGSGITRFDNGNLNDDQILRCILHTLGASGERFRDGVEVVLTKDAADGMKLYEVQSYGELWS